MITFLIEIGRLLKHMLWAEADAETTPFAPVLYHLYLAVSRLDFILI